MVAGLEQDGGLSEQPKRLRPAESRLLRLQHGRGPGYSGRGARAPLQGGHPPDGWVIRFRPSAGGGGVEFRAAAEGASAAARREIRFRSAGRDVAKATL